MRNHKSSLIASLLVLFMTVLSAAGQEARQTGLRPRWMPEKSLENALASRHHPDRIILKIRDDALASAEGGRLHSSQAGLDVSAVSALLDAFPGTRVQRLLPVDNAALDNLRRRGERGLGQRMADLSQFFTIELSREEDLLPMLGALLARDEVENAYAAPLAAPSPGDIVPPVTPGFTGNQGYLLPAPTGIDALYAQTLPGGTAAGVDIIDIEYRWNLNHEDLMANGPGSLIGNAPSMPFGWTAFMWAMELEHGTAVLGELTGDVDASGISGMAPNAGLNVIAANTAANGYNVSLALVLATLNLSSGDVILLEQQAFGPAPNFPLVPVEYNDAEFHAIRQATALGIHVIAAAGNGSQDLDNTNPGTGGHPTYSRFNLAVRDSGSIIVGAGTDTFPRGRVGTSNFGSRVGAHAWGQNVFTLGYGPNNPTFFGAPDPFPPGAFDPNQWYTGAFNATSAASPQVASAAAILEAAHMSKHSERYRPDALRMLIRTTGTPSANPASDRIGTMPDLKDQMDSLPIGRQLAHVFTGQNFDDKLGYSVANAGDVDSDGFNDIIVGAPMPDTGASQDGAAFVYSGKTGTMLLAYAASPGSASMLGFAVGSAGDLTGDGIPELLIGAPNSSAGGSLAGEVRIEDPTASTVKILTGAAGQLFGSSVEGLGDLNGDGKAEFIVGAPSQTGTAGWAYVYDGATFTPMYSVSGVGGWDNLGWSVANAGDVNQDGKNDFIIGAPQLMPSGIPTGMAYLYSGADGSQLKALPGQFQGDAFGLSVAGAGDVNGDGNADVIIGAPFNDAGGFSAGRAYVYSGATFALMYTFTGSSGGAALGSSVAGAGDVDGDGVLDLLVGAAASGGFTGAGKAFTYSGKTGALLSTYRGNSLNPDNAFGRSVASLGDLNGDRKSEIIVGAPGNDGTSPIDDDFGRAYVFFAPPASGTPSAPGLVADPPWIQDANPNSTSSQLVIRAGAAEAGRMYLVLAGVTGSVPGTALPGGQIIPLNFDALTNFALMAANSPPFLNFMGNLDSSGNALAVFGNFAPGALAGAVGLQITFAAVTQGFTFISNPVEVTILP